MPVVIQDPVWEQSFPPVAGVVVPYVAPGGNRPTLVRLSETEVGLRARENEARLQWLLRRFRLHEFDPVVLGTSAPAAIDAAFLRWAHRRKLRRRRR